MQPIELHPSTQLAWAMANIEAYQAGSKYIEPLHLYVALLKILDDAFFQEAEVFGVPRNAIAGIQASARECRSSLPFSPDEITALRRFAQRSLTRKEAKYPPGMLHRATVTRVYFHNAMILAAQKNALSLILRHLLTAIHQEPSPDISMFLESFRPGTTQRVIAGTAGGQVQESGLPEAGGQAASSNENPEKVGAQTPHIDMMGRDLTLLAREKKLVPVFGRDREMKSLARYLVRTSKRNVILTGEAGVGKTAVVEGFVQKLVSQEAPDILRKLRIVQINIADLVSGAKYRGDMEERVQGIIREATADPCLVLFFDEIHLLMKSGTGGESAMDIANILKPALSRDDFRCIGATTTEEFERYIKSDAAFMRRFQVLRVEAPSEEDALAICIQWVQRIEDIQQVAFDEEAVRAAVSLSNQWVPNRSLPDKAIDLLENAAAFVKVTSLSPNYAAMTKELPRIGRREIIAVLEEQYGISLRMDEFVDWEKLPSLLKADLVGQDEALDSLVEAMQASAAGEDASRPLGVFLFTGPTGVGKTYTAECLSRAMFGKGDRALARFNMNEYKERHELARLIGAPPGFIGHDQQGALFRFIDVHPQGLILLDEFEKAHPEIQDYFLQIFDKGEAQDSQGRKVSFHRHIFVMTCNVLPEEGQKHKIGFQHAAEKKEEKNRGKAVMERLRQYFRQEFIARVDRVVEFRNLDGEDYLRLLEQKLDALLANIAQTRDVSVEISDRVKQDLCLYCADNQEGARGFIREYERILASPLMDYLRTNPEHDCIAIDWVQDKMFIKPTAQPCMESKGGNKEM